MADSGFARARQGLALLAVVGSAVAGLAMALRRRSGPPGELPLDPASRRDGDPRDRGRSAAPGVDLGALQGIEGYDPAVQYLTYLQSKRGAREELLFVRTSDLDVLARREGMATDEYLNRLDRLGVVVSSN